MAEEESPCITSGIARKMGIGMTNAPNIRRRFIDRGIIKDQKMGLVDFDMPAFRVLLSEHPAVWC